METIIIILLGIVAVVLAVIAFTASRNSVAAAREAAENIRQLSNDKIQAEERLAAAEKT